MAADKSSEADILTFTFNNDMVIGEPIIDGTDISFMISDDMTNEQLSTLAPTFTISQGAVVDKQSGTEQDFTQPVVYTVTSEDGIVKSNIRWLLSAKKKKSILMHGQLLNLKQVALLRVMKHL